MTSIGTVTTRLLIASPTPVSGLHRAPETERRAQAVAWVGYRATVTVRPCHLGERPARMTGRVHDVAVAHDDPTRGLLVIAATPYPAAIPLAAIDRIERASP